MTVTFKNYPLSNRVPGVYAEIDGSKANTGTENLRALLIGQRAGGTAVSAQPVLVSGAADAQTLFGAGSMLSEMVSAFRAGNPTSELWALPVDDAVGATKATASLTFAGTATENGAIGVYVGGKVFPVAVQTGDDAVTVATRFLRVACGQANNVTIGSGSKTFALSNAATPLLATDATTVTLTGSPTLTLTYVHGGLAGNDLDLALNLGGTSAGERAPAGITVTPTAFAGGTVNPVIATALAALADAPFDFIGCPYTDTASLDALRDLLDDTSGRWSWNRAVFGHAFAALRATLGAATAFGVTRNDRHVSVMPFNASPTPAWVWAAAFTAQAAASLTVDPALPVTQLPLVGVIAPAPGARFTITDRNVLLYDGLSTFIVGADGVVYVERVVTTYQHTPAGYADNSYLDVETLATLTYVVRDIRQYLSTTFARKKLVTDATRIPGGNPNVTTAKLIKASVIARYRKLEADGYVQNGDAFAAAVQVENKGNGVIAVKWPGDLSNQLRTIAVLVQFQKS